MEMIIDRKQWTLAGAMVAVAVSATVGILCARGHVRSRNGPGAEVELESVEKVTVRMLREPIATTAFAATTLDGRPISSADWRGKVVLVNFWATWCPPCRAEIPNLIALQEKYRDHLVVVGIAEDEGSDDDVKHFVAEHKINYPIVISTAELRKIFPAVMALPTTFVLDRDGNLTQKNVGMLNAKETEAGTRLLAGLKVNAEVVRVEANEKAVGLKNAAQARDIPGVDLTKLSADQRTSLLMALNQEACTCGCGLTVAKCRIDDPNCPFSLPQARAIVEKLAPFNP
jgi:thiol-disulfide isomerase/thioredoxin